MSGQLPTILLVTGTGTGVGKTVTTAALAAKALRRGQSVCVVKPVQTGVSVDTPDIDEIRRLLGSLAATGLSIAEFVRLPEPLAPQEAARLVGTRLLPVKEHAERILELAQRHDVVIVEGAGGVLVRLDDDGGTLADLAGLLPGAQVVIATQAGLGTLNVTELTVEALRHRAVQLAGLVIGRWPAQPGLAELGNLRDLPALTGVRLLGVVHEGLTVPPELVVLDRR